MTYLSSVSLTICSVLRKAYDDRLQVCKDAATTEQQRLRDEATNKEKEIHKDWQQKQHLVYFLKVVISRCYKHTERSLIKQKQKPTPD